VWLQFGFHAFAYDKAKTAGHVRTPADKPPTQPTPLASARIAAASLAIAAATALAGIARAETGRAGGETLPGSDAPTMLFVTYHAEPTCESFGDLFQSSSEDYPSAASCAEALYKRLPSYSWDYGPGRNTTSGVCARNKEGLGAARGGCYPIPKGSHFGNLSKEWLEDIVEKTRNGLAADYESYTMKVLLTEVFREAALPPSQVGSLCRQENAFMKSQYVLDRCFVMKGNDRSMPRSAIITVSQGRPPEFRFSAFNTNTCSGDWWFVTPWDLPALNGCAIIPPYPPRGPPSNVTSNHQLRTLTTSPSLSPSPNYSVVPSRSAQPTSSPSPSLSPWKSPRVPRASRSASPSPSAAPSQSAAPSESPAPSQSAAPSQLASPSTTAIPSLTATPSQSAEPSWSAPPTPSASTISLSESSPSAANDQKPLFPSPAARSAASSHPVSAVMFMFMFLHKFV
jgi:hypothetical protein